MIIGTGIGVQIQQSSGRYPQRIYNNGNNAGTINDVKVFLNGVDTGKTITIDRDNVVHGITIEDYSDDGLDLTQELTFKFSDKYYMGGNSWSAETVEYVATCTLDDIKNGTTLVFEAPAIKIYEINIPTTQKVKVQQDSGRYPQRIYNGGTESVTVSVGGVNGNITINKDKVTNTNDVKISIPAGVNPTDTIRFTFGDRYCTGVEESWLGDLEGFNFSDSNVTYSFECTVEEFINGVTLNFTR